MMSMEQTLEASSSLESGTGGGDCASDRAPTGDLASPRVLGFTQRSTDRHRFALDATEAAVTTRFTICCALITTLVVIVLLAITGSIWYRYVLRPSMLFEQTTRTREEQRQVVVVVVEATNITPLAQSMSAHVGRNHSRSTWANTTAPTTPFRTTPNSSVPNAATLTLPEELLPAPL